MKTLQERLKQFLEYMALPMQTFERKCGIGQGLGSKLSTKSYTTTFMRIGTAFPQLNIEWLKTGEGSMLNPGAEDSPAQPADSAAPPTTLDKALDEIAAQRRIVERLICVIERMAGGTEK